MTGHSATLAQYQDSEAIDRTAVRARVRDLADRSSRSLAIDIDQAGRYAEQALDLASAAGDPECEAHALLAVGRYRCTIGAFRESIELLERSCGIFRDLQDRQGEAEATLRIGIAHDQQGEYVDSLAFFQTSLELAERIHADSLVASARVCLGVWHTMRDDTATALQFLLEAADIFERLQDGRQLVTVRINIANVHFRLGNIDRAIEERKLALVPAQQLGLRRFEAELLGEIGAAYLHKQEYALAMRFVDQSLEILDHQEPSSLRARMYSYKGAIYRHQGAFTQARETFLDALELFNVAGDQRLYAYCCLDIGNVYGNEGNAVEARLWMERALAVMEERQFINELFTVHQNLSTICEQLGDFKSAMYHFRRFYTVREESRGIEQRRRLEQFEERIKAERRAAELRIEQERAEQLERQMELQARDLMTLGAQVSRTNEFLNQLGQTLDDLIVGSGPEFGAALGAIAQQVRSSAASDGDWHLFEEQFKRAHPGFLATLRERFPDLSPSELKICVLIAAGLSSRDMANILCVSLRSVETYRFRIRKKIELANDENLTEFLSAMQNGG